MKEKKKIKIWESQNKYNHTNEFYNTDKCTLFEFITQAIVIRKNSTDPMKRHYIFSPFNHDK